MLESRLWFVPMADATAIGDAILEIIAPDTPPRSVRIDRSPFLIGRGSGNQLVLSDGRISRSAAAIIIDERYCLKPSPPSGRVAESSQL
jgi:hypothetical protein